MTARWNLEIFFIALIGFRQACYQKFRISAKCEKRYLSISFYASVGSLLRSLAESFMVMILLKEMSATKEKENR